jgi:hypothetical protein
VPAWVSSVAGDRLHGMRVADVQREVLKLVVRRFLSTQEATPRIQLVKQVRDPDLVDGLVPVILRNPVGDKLFPTALAFECCGDSEALMIARKSVETVIHVLQRLFEIHIEKMDFTIGEVEQQARIIFPALEPMTVTLGLYLVQDFSGVHAGIGGMWPNITFVRIHEKIGLLQNVAAAWNEHVNKYNLYLAGDSNKQANAKDLAPSSIAGTNKREEDAQWDFFISHASEDKQAIARPLADTLLAKGMKVWYDEFSLTVGDSLRESIDRGLSQSRFGIVILSRHFFAKHWPQKELNGLATREVDGRKVILPVWHGVRVKEVRSYSPMLADRIAVSTDNSLEHVVEKLLTAAGLQPIVARKTQTRPGRVAPNELLRENPKAGDGLGPVLGESSIAGLPTTSAEKQKRGRRTIPDNFLLGARNDWAALLEETWPEIGWNLVRIREERNGTIEDIRRAFEPVQGKRHNPGLAAPFYRQSCETSKPAEFLKNAKQLGKLDAEIIQVQAKRDDFQRLCRDAEAALKLARPDDRNTIQDEATQRAQRLVDLEDSLQKLKSDRDALDLRLADQAAYIYRSELLDLLSLGRPVVNPRNLANAVAGLPRMGWRHSFNRCSGMPFNQPRFEHSVFAAITEVWGRRSQEFKTPPLDFFRAELKKLSKELGYTRQFLWDNWSDLRKAIEECWKSRQAPASIPFVLTSLFMRNVMQQKNPAERILADREKLEG